MERLEGLFSSRAFARKPWTSSRVTSGAVDRACWSRRAVPKLYGVGWLVGRAVSLGRVFPFLSGAGPSSLYHGGEPVVYFNFFLLFHDLANGSRMSRTLKRGIPYSNSKVGYECCSPPRMTSRGRSNGDSVSQGPYPFFEESMTKVVRHKGRSSSAKGREQIAVIHLSCARTPG